MALSVEEREAQLEQISQYSFNATKEAQKAESNGGLDFTNPSLALTLAVVALDTKGSQVHVDATSKSNHAKIVEQIQTFTEEKKVKDAPQYGIDPMQLAWECEMQSVNVQNETALVQSQVLQNNAIDQSHYINLSQEVQLTMPSAWDEANISSTDQDTQSTLSTDMTKDNIENEAKQQVISYFTNCIMTDRQNAQVGMSQLDAVTQSSQSGQQISSSIMQLELTVTQKINYKKM